MLKGFNPWQLRAATIGTLGALLAIIGSIGPWHPYIVSGGAIALVSILMLILLGNRQHGRQTKHLQRDLQDVARNSHQSDQATSSATNTRASIVGAKYEYARRIGGNIAQYESFALKSKSLEIRDAFALAATHNELSYADLSRFVAMQRMEMLPAIKRFNLRHWNHEAFFAIARLEANQRATELDLENSVRMFSFGEAFFGTKALSRNDRLIYLEALGELNRFDEQSKLADRFNIEKHLPVHRALIKLNALQRLTGASAVEWIDSLSALYVNHGFSPIHMTQSSTTRPLDKLRTQTSPVHEGPLVSVIVPTYQGGPQLISAVNSLLEQSWKNIEIIIVDDGSGDDYREYLDQASNLSPKVRLIELQSNLGAYSARNAGVAEAKGEYITVHDDDDWSHGDKIATQVQYLIRNPTVPGSMSSLVRATHDLKFLRINANPTLLQTNYSSLMVHRSTFAKVGLWDSVNRGADSEFRDRIVKYYGAAPAVLKAVPLSLTRIWEGSLTSGELSRGFVDPARLLYAKAYKQWHHKVADQLEFLRPVEPRNFPVPTNMLPGPKKIDLGHLDSVYMADFRSKSARVAAIISEMEEKSRDGYRIGFIHVESPLNAPKLEVSQKLFDLQLAGAITQTGLRDTGEVDTLLVRDPSVMMFMDAAETNLQVHRAALVIDSLPIQTGGLDIVYDLATCLHNLDRLSSNRSEVIAEHPDIKEICQYLVPTSRIVEMTIKRY